MQEFHLTTMHCLGLTLGLGAMCACSGGGETADASTRDAGVQTVTIYGIVRNEAALPVASSEVSVVEFPERVTLTAGDGTWTLQVPRSEQVTLSVATADYATTLTHPVRFTRVQTDLDIKIVGTDTYATLAELGEPKPEGAIFFVLPRATDGCSVEGGHIAAEPATGTVVYAGSTTAPDPELTSLIEQGSAYVIGASGTVSPTVDVAGDCDQDPFPVETGVMGSMVFAGSITARPGAFHLVNVFVHRAD
jgi:hypothetical protein